MRKKLMIAVLAVMMYGLLLTGCSGGNDQAKIYGAYAEFYEEFCDENDDEDGDCGGQIILDKDGNPLLALCDISEESDVWMADVYIYEYVDGKVEVLEKQKNIAVYGEGIFIDSVDGVITMYVPTQEGQFGGSIYTLVEDELETDIIYSEDEGNTYSEFWKKTFSNDYSFLFSALFCPNERDQAIEGSDFEKLLELLAEVKPASMWDLKLLYTDFFKDENIYDEVFFSYEEENGVYCYSSADNKFYYAGALNVSIDEDDIKNVKPEIEGIEVAIADSFYRELAENIEYEDIEAFEYLGDKITIETSNGFSFEMPTTFVDVYNNTKEISWYIYIEENNINKETTGDAAKKYLEAGLVTNIAFSFGTDQENHRVIESITITVADMESYVSVLSEREQMEYMMELEVIPAYEAYMADNYGSGDYGVYNLIYIDDDNIPELLHDNSADGRATKVISYQNGTICESDAWCRGFDFDYIPKGNKVIFSGAWWGDLYGTVAHMENGYLVTDHTFESNMEYDMETGLEEYIYSIDGKECSESEYNALKEKYFNRESMEYGWDQYDSIREAYRNFLYNN